MKHTVLLVALAACGVDNFRSDTARVQRREVAVTLTR
jgi:hypothetical protein